MEKEMDKENQMVRMRSILSLKKSRNVLAIKGMMHLGTLKVSLKDFDEVPYCVESFPECARIRR